MAANKVAMCYHEPIPKLIENVNGHSYFFDCQWSVSLAWVEPEDVPALLAVRGGCCGGTKQLCHIAGELEIKVFETGHY